MTYFKEWSQQLYTRRGTMVPVEKFAEIIKYVNDPGYSSVYSFNEKDATEIIESGESRNFSKYTVISDTLSIDLDDAGASLPSVLDKLKDYRYELYSSGGKGHHIILSHDLIDSMDLPYSQKRWIESKEITCDMTLYQAGRILSLPGRIHKKTGKRKILLDRQEGDLISVELTQKPEIVFSYSQICGSDLSTALAGLWNLSIKEPEDGTKHMTIWRISSKLFEAGFDKPSVENFIYTIAETWDSTRSEEELSKPIDQAYRRTHCE